MVQVLVKAEKVLSMLTDAVPFKLPRANREYRYVGLKDSHKKHGFFDLQTLTQKELTQGVHAQVLRYCTSD